MIPPRRNDMTIRTWLFCFLAALALPAAAQDSYPSKPVKILVPYGPGGATDIIARILAQRLTETLGQTFIVDNRPGANGNIALEAAAKAPPDGYTLLIGNVSTNTINENTFASQLTIKPSRDLAGIAKLVEIPHVIVASAAFAPGTLAELVAEAKKEPGKINYSSAGLGSYPHLDMEKFQRAAGIQFTHVPYKALATTAPQRLPELPNVPTLAEAGFPGIGTNAWQGLFAPAATPAPVVAKLHGAVIAALSRPEQKEGLAKQMMSVEVSKSPQEFTELVRRETQAWGEFLREARIKIE
jgi:tripartite-type tricarboxylate transporter receptor subunit TctC